MLSSLNPPVQVKPLSSIPILVPIYQLLLEHKQLHNQSTNKRTNQSPFNKIMNKLRPTPLSSTSGLLHHVKRCNVRGRNYAVRPKLMQRNFSKDEDDLIFKLHALLGNRWSLIAGRLPGRTDNEVKLYWETYLKRKLIKMGIDPTNHRLYHHTNYITTRYLNSSHKEHETNSITDQSSSISESCDRTILPISSTNGSEDSTSTGPSRLPDLNVSPIPIVTVTSLPASCLEDSSESTGQETLLLFR